MWDVCIWGRELFCLLETSGERVAVSVEVIMFQIKLFGELEHIGLGLFG